MSKTYGLTKACKPCSKKVVIIGPESTGKSTLSQELAHHYQTAWVPESARAYLDQLHRQYNKEDLLEIGKMQISAEDEMTSGTAGHLLFCDTDLYVIKVWSEHKYAYCAPWILQQIAKRKYDLYLLTYIDIPWTDDPQREHPQPEMREYFYRVYRNIVIESGTPWALIKGDYEERLTQATAVIEKYL